MVAKTAIKTAVKGNGGILRLRWSFNNITKDPQIDFFRTLFQKESGLKETDLAVLAGLHANTVKNMFGGKTSKPQSLTFQKLGAAIGYRQEWSRYKEPDYESEIPKAREEFRAYKVAQAKKKGRKK